MKNIILCIITTFLLVSCSIRKEHYLGTLENVKFIVSKEDSIKVDSMKRSLKETQEKIDKEKSLSWIYVLSHLTIWNLREGQMLLDGCFIINSKLIKILKVGKISSVLL
jgi:hypothetical protein